jgi:YgiT-type zinc finger domain-containing protein
MTCLICRQAELDEGLTSVTFERGEFRLVVNEVPARVCPSCGEAYVEQGTAVQLLRLARESSEAGMLDTQCNYSPLEV